MAKKTELITALKTHFGFDKFKGQQEAIIQNVLDGHDTFVLMPTGGGKSLCYQLPALIMEGTAVVISPLIALMKNQVDAMRRFANDDSIAHFLNSSLNKAAIEEVKEDIRNGKTKILYVAPESLNKDENIEFLRNNKISFYAIDEAHCISEWGHDFRPEYRRIKPITEKIGKAPVIALTATATPTHVVTSSQTPHAMATLLCRSRPSMSPTQCPRCRMALMEASGNASRQHCRGSARRNLYISLRAWHSTRRARIGLSNTPRRGTTISACLSPTTSIRLCLRLIPMALARLWMPPPWASGSRISPTRAATTSTPLPWTRLRLGRASTSS